MVAQMEIPVYGTFIQIPSFVIKPLSPFRRMVLSVAAALVVISTASGAFASQLVLNSTGGAMSIGTDFVLTGATVANPAGTISIHCPITSVGNGTYLVTYNCSSGQFSYQSIDGMTTVSASFGTAAAYLSASGGEKAVTFTTITASRQLHWNRNYQRRHWRDTRRNQGDDESSHLGARALPPRVAVLRESIPLIRQFTSPTIRSPALFEQMTYGARISRLSAAPARA